ncbi:MAG: hypothetical protein OEZ39_07715 [Gammaproteobacteria bacterium]|nr:hypothetical protein [Gammaproteobacteria bacterium]MDH5651746.1 hypothetical protein [Gammaproteobacteria bacterium]
MASDEYREFRITEKKPGPLHWWMTGVGSACLVAVIHVVFDSLLAALLLIISGVLLLYIAYTSYQRLPVQTFPLLSLRGHQLDITSLHNPWFAGGRTFQEPVSIDLDSIRYIKFAEHQVQNVGNYIEVSFYDDSRQETQTWFSSRYWKNIRSIFQFVLDRFTTIQYSVKEGKLVPDLHECKAEMIEFNTFIAMQEQAKSTRFSYRDNLPAEVWQNLCRIPILVFREIAMADYVITREETQLFSRLLGRADGFISLLLAEVMADLKQQLAGEETLSTSGNIKALIRELDPLLDAEFLDEWQRYRQGVFDIARQIAALAGDSNSLPPPAVTAKLTRIHSELQL